ncbi:10667_t:CDS:2, partial [Acaulospora colombiana]
MTEGTRSTSSSPRYFSDKSRPSILSNIYILRLVRTFVLRSYLISGRTHKETYPEFN